MIKLSKHAQYQLRHFHGTHSDMSYKLLEVLSEIDTELVEKYKLFDVWGKIHELNKKTYADLAVKLNK